MATSIDLKSMSLFSFAFRNDLHALHHNCRGRDFHDVHELFGDYYDRALEDFDYFAEHSIATEEINEYPNLNIAMKDIMDIWEPLTWDQKSLSVEKAMKLFVQQCTEYIDALDMCREYCEGQEWEHICSDIDTIKSYWDTESNYKAKHYITPGRED